MKFENYLKEIAAIHEEVAIAIHLHSVASKDSRSVDFNPNAIAEEITDRGAVLKQAIWRYHNEPLFNRVVQNAVYRIEALSNDNS